jgi:uncharacterized protein YjbI with pentapeptide repeats
MVTKSKGRVAPRIEEEQLTATFAEQLASGAVYDAFADGLALPPLISPRGQAASIEGCIFRSVTLSDSRAQRLHMRDARIENSDLANVNLTGSSLERVEIIATRLTGATWSESQFKSLLFRECKLDLALFRMAHLENCEFHNCILVDADFYSADLSGAIFRKCDLSRVDFSHAKLTGADIRDCCIDRVRGTPDSMAGLRISADQAALLITLFGVRVEP